MPDVVAQLSGLFSNLSLMGEGATSAVYFGRRLSDDKKCVVKVFLRPFEEAKEGQPLARFERECKALASLDHPNIVKLIEWGAAETFPYLVLEFQAATSLQETLSRRPTPLPWRETVEMIATLADALAHAHSREIIHRDIKPANILIRKDGSPMFIDFGLVRSGLMQTYRTATGVILGSPSYMAPELFGTERATESTDLYSLGVVLYEMLTQERLFSGNLHEIMKLKLSGKIPSLKNGQLPRKLIEIVEGLLAPKSKRLELTAKELAKELRALKIGIADLAASKRSTVPLTPPKEIPTKRRPYWILAPIVLMLALFIVREPTPKTNLTPVQIGQLVKNKKLPLHVAFNKRAPLEDLARLYEAEQARSQKKWEKVLSSLLPIFERRRLDVVEEPSTLVQWALAAAKKLPAKKREAFEAIGWFIIDSSKEKCPNHEAMVIKSKLLTYYDSRPLEIRLFARLNSILRMLDHGQFIDEKQTELGQVLLQELISNFPELLIQKGVHIASLEKESFPFLLGAHALLLGSEQWRERHGWSLIKPIIGPGNALPQPRYLALNVFLKLIESPSVWQVCKEFLPYAERIMLQTDFHNRPHSDVRHLWIGCRAHRLWGPGKSKRPKEKSSLAEQTEFKLECLKKRFLNRKNLLNGLPPNMLESGLLVQFWFLTGRSQRCWYYLSPLLDMSLEYRVSSRAFFEDACKLACSASTSKRLRLEIIRKLQEVLRQCKQPEQRALINVNLLVIAAKQCIPSRMPRKGPTKEQLKTYGKAFRKAGPLATENLDIPQGFTDEEYGLLLCATGTGGALPIGIPVFKALSTELCRVFEQHKELKGQQPWLLRYLASNSRPKLRWAALSGTLPFLQNVSEKTADGRLFRLATSFWPPERAFEPYAKDIKKLREGLKSERCAFVELDLFEQLFPNLGVSLQWCENLVTISKHTELLLESYTSDVERIPKEQQVLVIRLLDLFGLSGTVADELSSQTERNDNFGQVPDFRHIARRVVIHADRLQQIKDLHPMYRLQIKLRRLNALIDAVQLEEAKKYLDELEPNKLPIGYRWRYWYERARWADYKLYKGLEVRKLIRKADNLPFVDRTRTHIVSLRTALRL